MPNYVQNRLEFEGTPEAIAEVKEFLSGSPYKDHGPVPIDFNQIIPMPEILRDNEPDTASVDAAKNHLKKSGFPLKGNYHPWKPKRIDDPIFTDDPKRMECLQKCIQAGKETGYVYWYDWACDMWGTKWNAYSHGEGENWITFQTAWSGVHVLIALVAKKFPNVKFKYEWADDNNTGRAETKDGHLNVEIIPSESDEAYKLFLKLHPDCDYIKKVDGERIYSEEE